MILVNTVLYLLYNGYEIAYSITQDFGKIAFTDRQNGVSAKWLDLSKEIKKSWLTITTNSITHTS